MTNIEARGYANEFFKIIKPYILQISKTGDFLKGTEPLQAIDLVIVPKQYHLEKFFLDNDRTIPNLETYYTERATTHPMYTLKWDRKIHQCRWKGQLINLHIQTKQEYEESLQL